MRLLRRLLVALALEAAIALAVVAVHPWSGHARTADPRLAPSAPTPVPTAHRFDATRAMALVRLQLAAGPRPAGSAALARTGDRLERLLPGARFETVPGPRQAHPLRNIVGTLPGTGRPIVLGAHYDTQPYPPGFVGANDAAAAVATVIEVARALRHARRPAGAPPIRFVLFDGEESPIDDDPDFYAHALRGSKAYVNAHGAAGMQAMVLLDYIGNRGVRLPREATSDAMLWSRVRAAAAHVGTQRVFPASIETAILDDHTPFLRAGIPAVDLIDWSYRPYDDDRDTYARLSRASVDAVGETMVELLRTWR